MNKVLLSVVIGGLFLAGCSQQSSSVRTIDTTAGDAKWERPQYVDSGSTTLDGYFGQSLSAVQHRLTVAPFDKNFVLADIDFNQKRRFTNFSGDISGRYIEAAASFSGGETMWPDILPDILADIPKNQKADGHFGAEVDWSKPIDFDPTTDQTVMMPLLWGNGRLLLGLCAVADRFGRNDILETAKKLGDFYVNTVCPRFCDSTKMDEYKKAGQFASAYVTCVYEGLEGLVNLYWITKDNRYLETAMKMADFHEPFDTLPIGHSHGSLGQTCALVCLYEACGKEVYLNRAIARWDEAVTQGYVHPAGGVGEHFWIKDSGDDEGCSEADWLRLSLLLWQETGLTKYLDMAERTYWNAMVPNQWPTGGFGHRTIVSDDMGYFAYTKPIAESYWCCTMHGAWVLGQMRHFLTAGNSAGVWYNFPMQYNTVVNVDGNPWLVSSRQEAGSQELVQEYIYTIELRSMVEVPYPPLHIRIPEWAKDVSVGLWRTGKPGEKINCELRRSTVPGRNVLSIYTDERVMGDNVPNLKYTVKFVAPPYLEDRRFHGVDLSNVKESETNRLDGVVLRSGPFVYMNRDSGAIEDLTQEAMFEKMLPYIAMTNQTSDHAFVFNLLLK